MYLVYLTESDKLNEGKGKYWMITLTCNIVKKLQCIKSLASDYKTEVIDVWEMANRVPGLWCRDTDILMVSIIKTQSIPKLHKQLWSYKSVMPIKD